MPPSLRSCPQFVASMLSFFASSQFYNEVNWKPTPSIMMMNWVSSCFTHGLTYLTIILDLPPRFFSMVPRSLCVEPRHPMAARRKVPCPSCRGKATAKASAGMLSNFGAHGAPGPQLQWEYDQCWVSHFKFSMVMLINGSSSNWT